MMAGSRRAFLRGMGGVACGLSVGMPVVWERVARAAPNAARPGGRPTVLVVVQLTGGNDGLNTVIPAGDPAYRAARPQLALARSSGLSLTADLMFHPACRGLAGLLERQQLGVVLGVGYPQPNRSHFVSMDIWNSASVVEGESTGWLGRAVDAWSANGSGEVGLGGSLHVGAGEAPLALESPRGKTFSLQRLDDYRLKVAEGKDDPARRLAIQGFAARRGSGGSAMLERIRQSAREAYDSSERIARVARESNRAGYPATELGQRLKLIAQLLESEIPERVYYTTQDGYDTHASQLPAHAGLLTELSDALAAFQKDLEAMGQAERVVTLVFSEFGRRVAENASAGTDHGAASTLFLVGSPVVAGPVGRYPSLTDLDDGDLKHTVDFRSVYQGLLADWLGVEPQRVLESEFAALRVVREG